MDRAYGRRQIIEFVATLVIDQTHIDTVRLLLRVVPDIFRNKIFAMKGGTAINLFVQDMPRLSVDVDVVYVPREHSREVNGSQLSRCVIISYAQSNMGVAIGRE